MVFADVTSIGQYEGRAVRNGNVMYEVGLAHAVRLPEEVLIFRSDSENLLFDVANVRINSYDPDGSPDQARKQVSEAIIESLNELDLKRNLAIKSASQAMDLDAWGVLTTAAMNNGISQFPTKTMGQALGNIAKNNAIVRLLDMGALETDFTKLSPELLKQLDKSEGDFFSYNVTEFGMAILRYSANELVGSSPDVQALLKQRAEEGDA